MFDVLDGEDVVPLLVSLLSKCQLRLINLLSLRIAEHSYCAVQVSGVAIDALLEELWRSRHRIESVTCC